MTRTTIRLTPDLTRGVECTNFVPRFDDVRHGRLSTGPDRLFLSDSTGSLVVEYARK